MKTLRNTNFSSIHFDSRTVVPDSLFVAVPGTITDGSKFIDEAIQKGAKIIVHETEVVNKKHGVTYIRVTDSHTALAKLAQAFFDHPSRKIKLVGVTGTNGKTTTATLLFKLFRALGHNVALISTIENKINESVYPATHTTPDPVALASFLDLAVRQGCEYAFMECSSQAIHQKRTLDLEFAGAIFTNLTHDHLDYHKTVEAYANAKKELFDGLSNNAFAITNIDDPHGAYMTQNTKAKTYSFGITNLKTDFLGKIIRQSPDGTILSINGKEIKTKLTGAFNAYNILGVFGAAELLGVDERAIIFNLAKIDPPKGRLEFIKSPNGIYGIVDYAHTPDALENVLRTVGEIKEDGAKIITVVGCGGDRDKTKRPMMGNITCALSDFAFFTSDNPRSENPESILRDMVAQFPESVKNYVCIADRAEAIQKACAMASPGDIILLAGKGHETYQVFAHETIHFSDMEELKKHL